MSRCEIAVRVLMFALGAACLACAVFMKPR